MNRIKIHNFGPVKNVDIELSKLMIFIGSQGTGKSTIAKLLTIFSDVFWWARLCDHNDPFVEFKNMGIEKYFAQNTYIEYWTMDCVCIMYKNDTFSISIDDYSQEEIRKICVSLVGEFTKGTLNELGYTIDDPQIETSMKKHHNLLRANLRLACYIPAERNMTSVVSSSLANIVLSKIPLPNTLMEYMSLFERARNHYSTYDASFLGVRYDKDRGQDCISVLGNAEKHLPLEECSSGIQSALPMLMVSDYACEEKSFDTFVVEEPEQNLFPTNQREVLGRLISIANREECQYMVINTHSPYLLSALNVSMLAAKIANSKGYDEAVDDIVPPQFQIDSSNVSVFSLGDETYCKSIIDETTGLISVNYLDVVSDSISSDFNRLYQIYLKTLQK